MRVPAVALLLPAFAALPACYTYTAASMETVRPGATVRAHLDESTAGELARRAGSAEPVPIVEGEVRGGEPDRLVLWWTVGAREVGARRQTLGQELRLSADQLRAVEVRELDRLRTGLAAGAAGAGLTALVVQLFGDTGRSPEGPDPGPVEVRIPLSWK